jgi:hypothetical protein
MVREAVEQLLREAVFGSVAGSTYFVDGAGLLETLRKLSAQEASMVGEGGATVAAHAEHIRWFLELFNAFARGERPALQWSESWGVRRVETGAWAELVAAIENEAEEAVILLRGSPEVESELLVPTLAMVAHLAYHLGAIRARLVARLALPRQS